MLTDVFLLLQTASNYEKPLVHNVMIGHMEGILFIFCSAEGKTDIKINTSVFSCLIP